MANGAFKFKDSYGNTVSFISGSGSDISFSGGTLNLSGMTGITLGNLTLSGTTQNATSASHAASYLLTSSFNTFTNDLNTLVGTLARTGSNIFKGSQTISGSVIPAVTNTYDLGSATNQFRHLYLSSASLYIDGTKVLGSTSQELQITTDVGQSFKILEAGSDNITLQSADGNIELKSSGGGDVVIDPTNGVIGLKGTVTVYTGNKVVSSDGNSIQFGNGITVTGSIVSTVTPLVSGSSQITYGGLTGIPSGIISGSAQLPSGLVSGSSQITSQGYATTGSNNFQGTQTITGSLFISQNLVVQGSSSLQNITASAVNIGANIINLNTANPAIRFAGLSIFDSGSIGGSGSFLYDSVQDEFIFVHRGDGLNITSSVALMGPQTYNNVGNETYPTANRLLKGTGNEHIGDSIVTETGGGIGISGSLSITGSIVATGTSLWSGSGQLPSGVVSGSSQILNGSGIWSGSAQLPSGTLSGSAQVDVMSTTNIARLATTGSNTFTGNQTLSNGQYLRGIRNSGALAINLLGIESGTDRTLMTATGDFVVQNGSLTSMLTLTTGGAATFAGRASFSGSTLIGEVQSSYALIETTAGNGIWLRPAGASSPTGLFVNTSGLVGVGLSNPTQKLNVDGLRGQPGTTGTTQNGLFRIGTLTNGYGEVMDMGVHVGVSGPSSYSWIQSTNQGSLSVNYNLALNPNGGNVGVGTNAPLAKLDVQGGSDGDGMISMGSNSVSGILNSPANMYINADSDNNSASGVIAFGFNRTGYSGGAEAVRILENGNFGINTTNPTQKLHVAGYIRTNGVSVYKNGGSISGFIGHEQDWLGTGSSNDLICASEGGNNFKVFTNGTTDVRLMVNTSGNIGVGTSSPSTKLDVNGNIKNGGRVYSGNAVTGNITTNLNPANTRNYILVCDLNDIAGFSMNGFMNAASYTCWNMSSFYIMKNYSSTTASAGITGQYKGGGCDMNIVDLSYGGGRYIAIGYTSNPEIDVIWAGYRLTHMLNSDGSAQVIAQSSVTVNSTLATY